MANPRAHLRVPCFSRDAANAVKIAPAATVTVYKDGSGTLFNQTMYDDNLAGGVRANPLIADANGVAEAWAPNPQTVTCIITAPGMTPYTVEANFEPFSGG